MASQPLAFAEILLGGLLVTSAIRKEPLGELLKKGLKGAQGASSTGASAGVVPGEAAGEGAPESEAEAIHKGELLAPPPAKTGGSEKEKLERYLKRKLTPKEEAELKRIEAG